MPHLAPLNWLALPLILLIIIYCHQIYFHFMPPTSFPSLSHPYPTFSKWKW